MKTSKLISEVNRHSQLEDLHIEKGDYAEYLKAAKKKQELMLRLEARTQKQRVYRGLPEYYTPKLR